MGSKVTMTIELHTQGSFNSPGKKTSGWRCGCHCYRAADQEELCSTKYATLDKWEGLKSGMTSLILLVLESVQDCQVILLQIIALCVKGKKGSLI